MRHLLLARPTAMTLHLLEFDATEDDLGVTCWDALAHPSAAHTPALLQEAKALLAWAGSLGLRGPGALEDGADWDCALHACWHRPAHAPVSADCHWCERTCTLHLSPAPSALHTLELGLSLSGGAAFVSAFTDAFTDAFANSFGSAFDRS